MALTFERIEQVLNKSERPETLLNTKKNQKNAMKCHLFILFILLQPKILTSIISHLTFNSNNCK